jgi:hypothetical protein
VLVLGTLPTLSEFAILIGLSVGMLWLGGYFFKLVKSYMVDYV